MKKNIFQQKIRGFSLLETVVTLGIITILLLMLSQILVTSLQISILTKERSSAREEMSNMVNLIRKDLRNADSVGSPDCPTIISPDSAILKYCNVQMSVQAVNVDWGLCSSYQTSTPNQICRREDGSITYQSSEKLNITKFDIFQKDSFTSDSNYQITLLLTITANHSNPDFNISNLYRQVLISTRNFNI